MIAIVGAGNVGMALAERCKAAGESIVLGVRDVLKYGDLGDRFGCAVVSVEEAIAKAQVVLLTVPHAAAADVATAIPDWEGRVLVDATNPIAAGLSGLSIGTTTSAAEQLAAVARNARVVKAFNTTGAENLANPQYVMAPVFLPICGDDAEARAIVLDLASRMGFDALDLGPLRAARYTEPFAMTWIHMAYACGLGRGFAFARMNRDTVTAGDH